MVLRPQNSATKPNQPTCKGKKRGEKKNNNRESTPQTGISKVKRAISVVDQKGGKGEKASVGGGEGSVWAVESQANKNN